MDISVPTITTTNVPWFTRQYDLLAATRQRDSCMDDCGTVKIDQQFVGDVGCVVWDAALQFCKYLEKKNQLNAFLFNSKLVLELGAGTGICSIIMACLGACVTATDLPEIVPILKRNRSINSDLIQGSLEVDVLDWADSEKKFLDTEFDFILTVDCLYYEAAVSPLVDTLVRYATSKTVIFMIYEVRQLGGHEKIVKKFVDLVSKHFSCREIESSEWDEEYYCSEIKGFILANKSN